MTAPTAVRHALNVDRGVALLDAKLGRDVWLPRIDTTRLDVSSIDRCVLCQATGIRCYGEALDSLGFTLKALAELREASVGAWTERHGFGLSYASRAEGETRDFAGLNAAWVWRIKQLRGEEVST